MPQRLGPLALCLLGLIALGGCAVDPATGTRHLNVLSDSEEIALGEEAGPQFLAEYGGEIPSPPIQSYVSDIGQRLAAVSERPNLPWEFHVVDSSVINAFALPGGKVFISRGLLAKMNNEAQLAGVLGHEVGHVTAQHIERQMGHALGVQVLATAVGVAAQYSEEDWMQVLGVGAQAGGTLYLLKFSRDQENQSDMLGIRYMTELGYSPLGQLQVMEILRDAAGGAGQIEFLSTHPLPATRIDRIRKFIRKNYPDAEDASAWTFGEREFERTVLDRLEQLPPAQHTGGQQAADAALHDHHDHAHAAGH